MGLPWRRCIGQGPHPVKTLEPRRFSRVALGFSKTTGISGFLLGWPWEDQSSIRVAMESWGFMARFPYMQAWTLSMLAGQIGDVHDPYGGTEADYEMCYEDIDRCIVKALPVIRAMLDDVREIDSSQLFEKEIMEEEKKDDSFRM